MSHLEDLIAEYYDWQGYLVKRNIHVGKRAKGGWEMELDIIAYNPHSKHLIHIEPSLDADPWAKREARFTKKFTLARKYILREVFTWLPNNTKIEQMAILARHPKDRNEVGGGKIKSVDELMHEIREKVNGSGMASKSAIPQQYPLLRTIQLLCNGYSKKPNV